MSFNFVGRRFFAGYTYRIFDFLDNRLWNNAVFLIVFGLDFASSCSFVQGAFHTSRNRVGVHNDPAFGVTRRPAYRLDERSFAP